MNAIQEIFREKGIKLTPQRLGVYSYLCNTNTHPSTDEIYKNIHADYPSMSLATVYKTLKTLTEKGLIQELNVGEGNFRYDANTKAHAHIQCLACKRVDDLKTDIELDFILDKVKDCTDYNIVYPQLYLYGYCSECQKKSR